jgi:hypothetical protein
MSDKAYDDYSLNMLKEWFHNAMDCDNLTPKEIFEAMMECIDEDIQYYKARVDKSEKMKRYFEEQFPVRYDYDDMEETVGDVIIHC